MLGSLHYSRMNIMELKLRIQTKLGHQKAEYYFDLLRRFLCFKMVKPEFDKLCTNVLGIQNIHLHNDLFRAILKNANFSKTPPPKFIKPKGSVGVQVLNGSKRSTLLSFCRDVVPQSPMKGRTPSLRERKFKDRRSPLGPNGKTRDVRFEDLTNKGQEHQCATVIVSLDSKPPAKVNSVEEGEEVEQAFGSSKFFSRSLVRAPLGISIHTKESRKALPNGMASALYTCQSSGELLGSTSLKSRLEQKLKTEGMKISMDCVNLLNNGLDVFLKGLVKPCSDLAASRSKHLNPVINQVVGCLNGMMPMTYIQNPTKSFSISMMDFWVAMESNPRLRGENWPVVLEHASSCISEAYS